MGILRDADSQKSVAIYNRYGTERQTRKDLSIVDQPKLLFMRIAAYIRARDSHNPTRQVELIEQQLRAITSWTTANCHVLVKLVISKGASVLDKRPELHSLINEALSNKHPYDAIVVNSMSRLYWDIKKLTQLNKRLRAAGVELIGLTHPPGDGTSCDGIYKAFMKVVAEGESRERKKRKQWAKKAPW